MAIKPNNVYKFSPNEEVLYKTKTKDGSRTVFVKASAIRSAISGRPLECADLRFEDGNYDLCEHSKLRPRGFLTEPVAVGQEFNHKDTLGYLNRLHYEGEIEIGGSKVTLPHKDARPVTLNGIPTGDKLRTSLDPRDVQSKVFVSKRTTSQAIYQAAKGGKKVIAVNFANESEPADGQAGYKFDGSKNAYVAVGQKRSVAQEENLCEKTDLYASLKTIDYPSFKSAECIFVSENTLWGVDLPDTTGNDFSASRELKSKTVPPVPVTIVSSAATKCGGWGRSSHSNFVRSDMRARIKLQLYALALEVKKARAEDKHTHVILGAFGCGQFGNDPRVVAEIYKDLLNKDFAGCFDTVEFAIPHFSKKDSNISGPFKEVESRGEFHENQLVINPTLGNDRVYRLKDVKDNSMRLQVVDIPPDGSRLQPEDLARGVYDNPRPIVLGMDLSSARQYLEPY